MKSYYPIMVDVENKPCLIIGGGKVAYRKAMELLKYKARIMIIAKEVSNEIVRLIDENRIVFLGKEYDSAFLDKVFFVIAATNDKEANNKILKQCNEKNILVSSVDNSKESSFIQPSKMKNGDITIAVSTGGKSPILSKIIRNKVENIIDDSYGEYLEILGEFRKKALAEIYDEEKRKEFFFKVTKEEYLNVIKELGREFVYRKIDEIFNEYIVGD